MLTALLTGIALAMFVSLPPGPNTALCITMAQRGARYALPVILSAAIVDAVYALLASGGVLVTTAVSTKLTDWLTPAFLALAAGLLWRMRFRPVAPEAAVGVAIINPATAALWTSLASFNLSQRGDGELIPVLAIGVLLGTATWFGVVAIMSAQVHATLGAAQTQWIRDACALALTALALLSLGRVTL